MPYSGLSGFISDLEDKNELVRIKAYADPVLEIAEISDRITKSRGKALLFENNGTQFPLLINAYGSEKRLKMALGLDNLEDPASRIESLFNGLTSGHNSIKDKITSIPGLLKMAALIPSRSGRRGKCQQVIITDPDLSVLPVLKCWPHDGGRFITLPIVHTINPLTGKTNAGMYRMQVLDRNTTAMHWQMHKTGAAHFREWKKSGRIMPVTVTLGGDPVYTYASTAPLPENIDEFILAGFLRQKKVKLVKCITNDLYVPSDSDIVIEGFVDPSEEAVWEGPFGDHTGFYSLADWYPKFHVTCITHSKDAVYPATIVGIPPMEDAWLTLATEKIFLAPMKLALQPEILDLHMPDAGTAHNLAIVKIRKEYPGQGKKVISSLFGAGQMMFTKYLLLVSGDIDIRNYRELAKHVLKNTDFKTDLLFTSGPMDVLDHSSDLFAFGGKLGIDATIKYQGEIPAETNKSSVDNTLVPDISERAEVLLRNLGLPFCHVEGLPMIIFGAASSFKPGPILDSLNNLCKECSEDARLILLAVDINVPADDLAISAWQILGNSDPGRDVKVISGKIFFTDGTMKYFASKPFPRKWPNIVSSSPTTISEIDRKWESFGLGQFIESPSNKYRNFSYGNSDEVTGKEYRPA
jgi:4-hydroxy-3-polyprenylbenzoate decarboxylase